MSTIPLLHLQLIQFGRIHRLSYPMKIGNLLNSSSTDAGFLDDKLDGSRYPVTVYKYNPYLWPTRQNFRV